MQDLYRVDVNKNSLPAQNDNQSINQSMLIKNI